MNLDFSFITQSWVQQQLKLKTIASKKWSNNITFLRPQNVHSDDPKINLLGKGVLIDPFYNIIHTSYPRIRIKESATFGKEMFGGILVRVFKLNGKMVITGMTNEAVVYPTSKMETNASFISEYTKTLDTHCLTFIVGLEKCVPLTAFNVSSGLLENLNVLTNYCKVESVFNDTSISTLNKSHYTTFRLFQNNVYNLYNVYIQWRVKKNYIHRPKKYQDLLFELHGEYLKTHQQVTKRQVADLIDSLSPWKLEILLLS